MELMGKPGATECEGQRLDVLDIFRQEVHGDGLFLCFSVADLVNEDCRHAGGNEDPHESQGDEGFSERERGAASGFAGGSAGASQAQRTMAVAWSVARGDGGLKMSHHICIGPLAAGL